MVLRNLIITALLLNAESQITRSMLLLTANIDDLKNIADKLLPQKMSRDLMKLVNVIARTKAKAKSALLKESKNVSIYKQVANNSWFNFKDQKNTSKYKIFKKFQPKDVKLKFDKKKKHSKKKQEKGLEEPLIDFDKHVDENEPQLVEEPQKPVSINWLKLKDDLAEADKLILNARKDFPLPPGGKERRVFKSKSKYIKKKRYRAEKEEKRQEPAFVVGVDSQKPRIRIKDDYYKKPVAPYLRYDESQSEVPGIQNYNKDDMPPIPGVRNDDDSKCRTKDETERTEGDILVATSGNFILTRPPEQDAWWEKKLPN